MFYKFLHCTADFYFLWKKCLFQLKQNGTSNNFSKLVADKMNIRTDKLFDNNDILLSSLYIDPRYNYIGKTWNPEMKARAEVMNV